MWYTWTLFPLNWIKQNNKAAQLLVLNTRIVEKTSNIKQIHMNIVFQLPININHLLRKWLYLEEMIGVYSHINGNCESHSHDLYSTLISLYFLLSAFPFVLDFSFQFTACQKQTLKKIYFTNKYVMQSRANWMKYCKKLQHFEH